MSHIGSGLLMGILLHIWTTMVPIVSTDFRLHVLEG